MVDIDFDRSHGGARPSDSLLADSLLDFSASINPFGPPAAVLDAYHRAAGAVGSYPEPYASTLTAAIAESLRVAPGNVLAGNGSTQLIYLVARVLRPRRPFVVIPTFSEIANSLLTMDANPAPLMLRREQHYELDAGAVDQALAAGADALFIGRPNSPTGTTVDLERMGEIARRSAARGCWCVIDEAFIEFADDPASAVMLVKDNPSVIVLRSMTKLYAIAGLRLGYLVAAQQAVAELARALEPWSVSGPAAAVGMACLAQPESWREEMRHALRLERAYLEAGLRAIAGVEVFASTANFLMFAVRAGSGPFAGHLRRHGIVVRDLSALPGAGPGLYRAAVRLRADNDRLLCAARSYR